MSPTTRRYTADEKNAAVARVLAGETQRAVALDLETSKSNVGRWCRESEDFLAQRDTPSPAALEAARLEKEEREEALEMAADGVVLWQIIDHFPHRSHWRVRDWLSGVECDRSRRPLPRNGRVDDGIVDEVAVARALRFDPEAIEVLRTTEYRHFCAIVAERGRRDRHHLYPSHAAWLALPKEQRSEITDLGNASFVRQSATVAA